ncbi:MAG: tRNA (N(6)-L-threonylcarbamoyladenosine(37)-C(2))-methylthiotransferase, partial [Candidatus Bathyarchaeia archaeon]
ALGSPLVVAGCMPKVQEELVEELVPKASLMGPDSIQKAVEVVEKTLKGVRVRFLEDMRVPKTCLPRVRRNPVVHIAPIATGCLGDCSYCIVKLARGRLFSYPLDSLVEDASRAISSGAREIWVTAQDTAAYRYEDAYLPDLLKALCGLEGRFYIRVGMMTPNVALSILEDLVESFREEKTFKFLHLPVQSGSDEVLRRMKRRYSVEDFKHLMARFREEIPEISFSTDIICGFPGETEDQFKDSLKLVEEVQPDFLNISRFGPRPGTEAAEMRPQLPGWETKRRSRLLTQLWRRLSRERNRRWVGWSGEVLIDEKGQGDTWVGRNYAYKPIVIKANAQLGDFVQVRILDAHAQYLLGEPLK